MRALALVAGLACAIALAIFPAADAGADICRWASEAARGRSEIDLRAHGVVPDDGADDGKALAAAIEVAGPEKTLIFAAGVYEISAPVALKPKQSLVGAPGAQLVRRGTGAGFILTADDSAGLRIACLSFKGGGLRFAGFTRGLAVIGNRFEAIHDPGAPFGHESALFIAGLTDRARISDNRFENIGMRAGAAGAKHGAAILAYHLNNSEISDNRFTSVHQGISLLFEGKAGSGLGVVVRGNRVEGAHRMGIEAQGAGASGARFENNHVRLEASGDETIGLSIVINGGEGTLISGNEVVSLTPGTKKCAGFGIEAAGIATRIQGNRVSGNWCTPIGVYADTKQHSIVSENRICGHTSQFPAIDFYHQKGISLASGNVIEGVCDPLQSQIEAAVRR